MNVELNAGMLFTRLVLGAASAVYLGFGIYSLCFPQAVSNALGLVATTPLADVEVRSVYGGLELGFGLFFLVCAMHAGWAGAGLAAMVATFGGLVTVRAIAAWMHGARGPVLWMLLLIEGGLFAAALTASLIGWLARSGRVTS